MAWKILLPQEIMSEGRKLLEDAGHTIIEGRGFETEDVLADMKEHQPDAMIVRITPITREVIEANPNLKVIVRHGAGFDALDVKACHDNGVQTLYAPVANSTSVAETAMLLILECSRNVTLLHKTWVDDYYKAKLKIRKNTLNGKTLGLIGCGNIGSRVVEILARGYDLKVLACDPVHHDDWADKLRAQGVDFEYTDLDTVVSNCDILTLNADLNPTSFHILNAECFAKMKKGVYVVNNARADLIDQPAMLDALADGTIKALAIDVMHDEPPAADDPYFNHPKVLVCPHISAYTEECLRGMGEKCVGDVERFVAGEEPVNEIRA